MQREHAEGNNEGNALAAVMSRVLGRRWLLRRRLDVDTRPRHFCKTHMMIGWLQNTFVQSLRPTICSQYLQHPGFVAKMAQTSPNLQSAANILELQHPGGVDFSANYATCAEYKFADRDAAAPVEMLLHC